MTAFFCDTNCEINYKTAAELGIKNIIRMPYTICDKEYFYDLGEKYDPKWFFNLVREGNIPITSALNPEDYKSYFEPFFKAGEDILYVSFSSEMSGTFKYMDMAVKELSAIYPSVKFKRYDTKGISMAAGLSVMAAAKAYNAGKSVEEICAYLDTIVPYINASVVVDDLQHLKRGGRLTAVKAALGTLLKLKPIIKLSEKGVLSPVENVAGRNKALMTITEEIIQKADNFEDFPIVIMNADCLEDAERVKAKILAAHPNATVWQYNVGPVIGTHCGPGTIGICYKSKERRPVIA